MYLMIIHFKIKNISKELICKKMSIMRNIIPNIAEIS